MAALALLWAGQTCVAQGKDKSLTKDFSQLSPKERSRIAAQETAEAEKDSTYQRLMREGDQAFRAGLYEDALAIFQEARQLRPYNVYPKVKIEDLQALIRKRDQEAAQAAPPPAPEVAEEMPPAQTVEPIPEATPVPSTEGKPEETDMMTEAPAPPPLPVQEPASREAPPPPGPAIPAAPEKKPVARIEEPPPAVKPSHTGPIGPGPEPELGERVYLEAGAVVTERTVEEEGKVVVYKRVAHSWGQTFYFRDGLSIPQRRWDEHFSTTDR